MKPAKNLGKWIGTVVGVLVALTLVLITATASNTNDTGSAITISVVSSSTYGKVLEVGDSNLVGFPIYEFSADAPGHPTCGTVHALGSDVGTVANVEMTCSGPMSDMMNSVTSDDWPAVTSSAPPIAGAGVDPALLSRIDRPGIGEQVTYAGHPLYLFDPPSAPFAPQGVNYMETVHPFAPWHGDWYLVSATNGDPVTGPARVSVGHLPNGTATITVATDQNVSPLEFDAYSYRRDSSTTVSCVEACARTWLPVLTNGPPVAGTGVLAGELGTTTIADGAHQVTYRGTPLYLYSREQVAVVTRGHQRRLWRQGTDGNGNRRSWGQGVFSLVAP